MKVSILVVKVIVPMVASIGLYCYAFLSTRWTVLDNDRIAQYNATNGQRDARPARNRTVRLDNQLVRHAFRSRSGLLGYCLDYRWLTLTTIASDRTPVEDPQSSEALRSAPVCDESAVYCPETNTCVRMPIGLDGA